jgi:hypothetical protein
MVLGELSVQGLERAGILRREPFGEHGEFGGSMPSGGRNQVHGHVD